MSRILTATVKPTQAFNIVEQMGLALKANHEQYLELQMADGDTLFFARLPDILISGSSLTGRITVILDKDKK